MIKTLIKNFDSNEMESEYENNSSASKIFQKNHSEITYDVKIAVIIIFIVVFLIGIILNVPAIERIRKV